MPYIPTHPILKPEYNHTSIKTGGGSLAYVTKIMPSQDTQLQPGFSYVIHLEAIVSITNLWVFFFLWEPISPPQNSSSVSSRNI